MIYRLSFRNSLATKPWDMFDSSHYFFFCFFFFAREHWRGRETCVGIMRGWVDNQHYQGFDKGVRGIIIPVRRAWYQSTDNFCGNWISAITAMSSTSERNCLMPPRLSIVWVLRGNGKRKRIETDGWIARQVDRYRAKLEDTCNCKGCCLYLPYTLVNVTGKQRR